MNEEQLTQEFARRMYLKIQERNDRYTPMGWKTLDPKRVLLLLKEEIAEFENRAKEDPDSDRSSEAIDIGNYAMFLWELTRHDNIVL